LNMGLSDSDVSKLCIGDVIPNVLTEWNFYDTLNNLNKREKSNKVDVPVHDYIRENFSRVRLFHTTNHPTKYLYAYILPFLCDFLNIPVIDAKNLSDKVENDMRMFILPCVHKHYQIDMSHESFSNNDCVIKGIKMKPDEYLSMLNSFTRDL
jgi:hypothetical protein